MKCEKWDKTFPNHKWGKIRAHSVGWYTTKNGYAYCPDHRPEYAPKRDK